MKNRRGVTSRAKFIKSPLNFYCPVLPDKNKKMMEKKVYMEPAMTVCQMETNEMMMSGSDLNRYEAPAKADLDVLSNKDNAWDMW